MSGLITSLVRNLLGYSDTGISVPPMDNMFKPNNRLEAATAIARIEALDDIAKTSDAIYCSAGEALLRVSTDPEGAPQVDELDRLDGMITFLAVREDGEIALATQEGGLRIGRPGAWRAVDLPEDQARCLTAGCFLPDGGLALCVGSTRNPASDWKRDLMQHGASGRVLSIAAQDGAIQTLADGLAFPYGIASMGDGALAVSESWRHRVVRLAPNARPVPMLSNLPAYPVRISPSEDGGYLLALFAPRRQLFEMILIEDEYRTEMMETIDPSEWVGPDLRQTDDPDQPLQQGSVRQMGILKPWAPSRSYGLAVRCDGSMIPLESWHSRADGTRHGITAILERDGAVFAASKGAGELLRLSDDEESAK